MIKQRAPQCNEFSARISLSNKLSIEPKREKRTDTSLPNLTFSGQRETSSSSSQRKV